jgi:hypothetical protein
LELLIFIAALALFGALASVYGVDTTDASSDPRRPPRPVGLS